MNNPCEWMHNRLATAVTHGAALGAMRNSPRAIPGGPGGVCGVGRDRFAVEPAGHGRFGLSRRRVSQLLGEVAASGYGLRSEDEDDGDEDDEPTPAGERPVVVHHSHPSWADVDAEQRDRIGDPFGEDSQP
jgi:hypothetical protein